MIEFAELPDSPALSGVWRNAETGSLYFVLNTQVFEARPGSTPQGAALWMAPCLPESAVEQELPAGYAGAVVRRAVLCWLSEENFALALDLGRDRCLCFLLEGEGAAAVRMQPVASCGEVECEIALMAKFPESVELPQEVVSRIRRCQYMLIASFALFIAGCICVKEVGTWCGIPLLVLGIVGFLAGGALLKRGEVCPWCGARELRFQGMKSMFCEHCQNVCSLPGR